jgi:hypothetical protein
MKPSFPLIVVAVYSLAYLSGCSRAPSNPSAALVGQYKLHIGNGNCSARGIESSTLELLPDGRSEQRDRFKDGSQFVTPGKWRYSADNHVALDDLRITTTGEIDKNASPINASLIVEWSKPPNILLNPDDDCFFAKAQ